jgi:hypothetical protein
MLHTLKTIARRLVVSDRKVNLMAMDDGRLAERGLDRDQFVRSYIAALGHR